jgi:transcription termination/antitermination protein NusA
MANQKEGTHVDLKESSVYGGDKPASEAANRSEDFATDTALDRLELITGGADEPVLAEGDLGKKLDELDATTEEEVDALKVNLLQDDERPNEQDGSGLIVDDTAEETLARFTEADPMQADLGAISVEPGREDTSEVLRRHHPNTSVARSEAVVEGNLDEPMDETIDESKVDEGTAG